MSIFTFRIAHLEKLPEQGLGELITEGDKIGRMGNTGQSKHNHLHMDCIHGYIREVVRLKDIADDREVSIKEYKSNEQQLNYFADSQLFKTDLVITTPYLSDKYEELFGKKHPALDVVPKDRHKTDEHFDIFWNRTKTGHVLSKGFDKNGYGNYILIGFES